MTFPQVLKSNPAEGDPLVREGLTKAEGGPLASVTVGFGQLINCSPD